MCYKLNNQQLTHVTDVLHFGEMRYKWHLIRV